jgi:hypothetical protein
MSRAARRIRRPPYLVIGREHQTRYSRIRYVPTLEQAAEIANQWLHRSKFGWAWLRIIDRSGPEERVAWEWEPPRQNRTPR